MPLSAGVALSDLVAGPDANQDPSAQSAPSAAPTPGSTPLPGSVTTAAVILLVFGTLAGLGALLTLFGIVLFSAMPGGSYGFPVDANQVRWPGWTGFQDTAAMVWMGLTFIVLFAALAAAVAGGHIAAGIAILKRRGWGRILGLVVSGVAVVVLLLGMAGSFMTAAVPLPPGFEDIPGYTRDYYRSMMAASVVFGVVFLGLVLVAYLYVILVLARRGDVFD